MRCIQTLGSDYKDAMLNCESDFHQSEDKRTSKLNCHKLRSSYVTSILITKITCALCFAQTEYIIRCYFSRCFISFVAFMRTLYSHVAQACLFRIK